VSADVDKASAFYREILGLKVLMDLGWIRTYGSSSKMTLQLSVMSEGGSERRVSRSNTARRANRGAYAGSSFAIHSES
jgi:catechol-2,3-dioxygenase